MSYGAERDNYMKTATSLEGYKHSISAKAKMVERFVDKI